MPTFLCANFPKTTMPTTVPMSNKTRGHRRAFQPNVVEIPKNSPAKTQLKKYRGVSGGLMCGFALRMNTASSIKAGNHTAAIATEIQSLDVPMMG